MSTDKSKELALFLDTHLDELLETPDEEILDGVNVSALKARQQAMITAASAEAGRRRLAAAKAGMANKNRALTHISAPITLQEAKAAIEAARNDSRFTLAARALNDMSEEDIFRLYQRILQLQASQKE